MNTITGPKIISKVISISKRFAMLLTIAGMVSCQGNAPDDLLLDAQPTALIFVKSNTSGTLDRSFMSGQDRSDLYSLTPISPNGQLKNLTNVAPNGGAVAETKTRGSPPVLRMA